MFGRSQAMQRLFEKMRCTAAHFRVATIEGEPGTGKTVAAQTLHAQCRETCTQLRAGATVHLAGAGPDVPAPEPLFLACAAAPALATLDALFEEANGGTLYLSRTSELSPGEQRQWLDIVEHFERHRSRNGTKAMPRQLLFGTCEPLRRLTAAASFRTDLAHRLTAIRFALPPLRERREDISLLVEVLLERVRATHSKPVRGLAPGTLNRLLAHTWPGNVRELETVLFNAALDCISEWIRPIDLPPITWPTSQRMHSAGTALPHPGSLSEATPDHPAACGSGQDLDPDLDRAILRHVTRVLGRVGGNKLRAAHLLGISRSTLYRLLESGHLQSGR
ncbi:sigma-54-dependent transcriptional regulator [Paracidobacterium acidisoli]|uniref:Sigma-54-dependent Fis family transcriptional regulator n=1 Tax=Paracidobacterium acidisoli TaxID=2303751 RepID=A0A372IR38_9BACT|nr:sigma 54-interacting transcriptional regulator [Paracidobacterium acidisoli]MBT9331233.1 sigma 54-interacting transcriptional regulator [Paracidobacterium acidisoli]